MSLEIFVPLTIRGSIFSTNQIYSGRAWQKRAKLKKDILTLTLFFKKIPPLNLTYPLVLDAVFYNSSIRDVDNHGFLLKMLIDALVFHGIIRDDNWKIISKISTEKINDKSLPCGVKLSLREKNA